MAGKSNRLMASISTILIFGIVAFLYIVPSVATLNGVRDIVAYGGTESSQPESEKAAPTAQKTPETSAPATAVAGEKKEAPEEYILHIHRDFKVQGYQVSVDAYDGYGAIRVPESLERRDMVYGLAAFAEVLGDDAETVLYAIDGNAINLIYNEGYSERELNAIINMLQDSVGGVQIIEIPAKPILKIGSQVVISKEPEPVEEPKEEAQATTIAVIQTLEPPKEEAVEAVIEEPVPTIEIHREIAFIGNDTIAIDAYDGEGNITLPGYITEDEIATALAKLCEDYPESAAYCEAAIDKNVIEIKYPTGLNESDINYYIDELEAYIASLLVVEEEPATTVAAVEEPAPAVEPVAAIKVPTKPIISYTASLVVPVEVSREMSLLGDTVIANATATYATLKFPSYVTRNEVYFGLAELAKAEPLFTLCQFSYSDNVLSIEYPQCTADDINLGLDVIEEFLASISIPVPEKPSFEVNSTLVEDVEDDHATRSINVYGTEITLDAYDGHGIISGLTGIDHEFIADCIVRLYDQFGSYLDGFEFSINDDRVEVSYPAGYSKSDLEFGLDNLIAYIQSL